MRAAAVWNLVARTPAPPSSATHLALLHSTAVSLSRSSVRSPSTVEGRNQESSKTNVRFTVRQKRADAKSALKNLLFNERPSKGFQDGGGKYQQSKKTGSKMKLHRSSSRKYQPSTSKRWQNRNNFSDDGQEYPDNSTGHFGGKTSFTWSWSGENLHWGDSSTGFEWRDNSQGPKIRKKVWSESDVEGEETWCDIDLRSQRITLGLPPTGPLRLDDVKSAFHASALKWHPDKHQGPSQTQAEQKFKLCVDAYASLSNALKPS